MGYLGSRGVKFSIGAFALDQLPPADMALGNGLNAQVPNPFYGQISTGVDATATVALAQLLRPYPQYNGVTSDLLDVANSSYHAMTVRAERRYSKGLTLLFSYTYSKTIDLQGIGFSGETDSTVTVQNWDNLKGEYAPSTIDQTHRFVFSAVYQMPFFKGRKGFLEAAFGGWEVGTILSHFTGGPLGLGQSTNNTDSQGGGQRPNWSGVSAALPNPTVYDWFDASQFSNAAPFTFGNVARTLGGLRSAGLQANADRHLCSINSSRFTNASSCSSGRNFSISRTLVPIRAAQYEPGSSGVRHGQHTEQSAANHSVCVEIAVLRTD